MRYATVGAIGYGLQIAAYVATAIVTAIYLSTSLYLHGLNVLGLLTPVPVLLISLAWIYAGKERKAALFTATGFVGLIVFVASIASTLILWILAPQIIQPNPSAPFTLQLLSTFLELAAVSAVVGLLAVIYFVLETISFFSAGRNFQEKMFRIAGWSRIAAVIGAAVLYVIFIFLSVLSAISSTPPGSTTTFVALQVTPNPNPFLSSFGLVLGGVYVILAIPEVFAFLGFRKLLTAVPNGALLPSGSTGATLQTAVTAFCPNCGTPVVVGARLCATCGKPLA